MATTTQEEPKGVEVDHNNGYHSGPTLREWCLPRHADLPDAYNSRQPGFPIYSPKKKANPGPLGE